MSKSFNTVKNLLPSLSPSELSQIKALLDLLGASSAGRKANGSATEDSLDQMFYEELGLALLEFGIKVPPYVVLKRGRNYKSYKKGKETLEDFLEKAAKPGRLTRIQRKKLYRISFKMLVNWLRDRNIPVSVNSVSLNLEKVPQLLMQDFPGYIETGLFMKLVESL